MKTSAITTQAYFDRFSHGKAIGKKKRKIYSWTRIGVPRSTSTYTAVMNFSSGFFDSLIIAISAPKIVPKKTVIAASFKVSHKPLMKMPEFSWKTWMTPGDFFATPSEPSNSMPSLEASVLASIVRTDPFR